MKRLFLDILMLFAVCSVASAHTIGVGNVNRQPGELTELQATGKTNCSAAVRLDASKFVRYAGNSIKTVRVSLPATKLFVDSVVVWVRSSLDGNNLSQGKITRFADDYPNLSEGWNEVTLANPIELTEATGELYVGYTYYQRTKVCATRWVKREDAAGSYVKLSGDAEWQEKKGYDIAIEAGIDGSAMPANDVWLMGARGLISDDGTRRIEARLYNRGQQQATSLQFKMEGSQYSGSTLQYAEIAPDCLDTIVFDIKGAEALAANSKLSLELDEVNGKADAYPDDNKANCLFNYLRIVLIEEFTTEQCPNCPRAAEYLHDLLESSDVMMNMAVVCHHSGYHTDSFTTQADLDYEWFYNADGATYAPALMYNRMPLGKSPVVGAYSKDVVEQYIKSIANKESSLALVAEAAVSDNNATMTVTVTGKRLQPYGNTEQRITVFLTEDNVLSVDGQAGSGTETYYHQHIMRRVNSTWGEPITWNGDDFQYTCTFSVDPAWKPSDLKVVASVGDYDSTSPNNCQIENNAVAIPEGWTDGIHKTSTDKGVAKPVAYFTMDGQMLKQPARGVTLVKMSDGTVRKVKM